MSRNVWIGSEVPTSGWQHSETPLVISEVTKIDNLALGYDISTADGAANGVEVVLIMAQSHSWPVFGIYVHETDENMRNMMVDALIRFAPDSVEIFESGDDGETWVPVVR